MEGMIKKSLVVLLLAAVGICAQAQQQAMILLGQARTHHNRNEFKEAFEKLRNAEQALSLDEQSKQKQMPEVRYSIVKERLQMYIKLKNAQRAGEQLTRMAELQKASAADSLYNDLLYTQASTYFTLGMRSRGDEAIARLIDRYKAEKSYERVNDCYRNLIDMARKTGNASLLAHAYEGYMQWTDSVRILTAKDELGALQAKYEQSQAIVQEKDASIGNKKLWIGLLCTVVVLLAIVLIAGGVLLLRFVVLSRKQKKQIATMGELADLKSAFIRNISVQMEPTLNRLDASMSEVVALRTFGQHIQELSELESTLNEPYELQEANVATFCARVVEKMNIRPAEDVTLTLNAPKLGIKLSAEPLEHILLHLLENAARYTPAGGKIILDFKKRGAHTHQFLVTDTGCGIPEERHKELFKPFAEVRELTQGDGLGLPICALMAAKMNGSLTLDESYTKGTRFILELHT